MVLPSLSIAAVVGVILSAGFVYVEVGGYATPQVPVTLFEERREIFAYTAGLFVGIPFAVAFLLYALAMVNGALPGALLFLLLLVGGTELAQWALLRSRYWGRTGSSPFYALGFRAAIGGIISLAIVAQYLGGPVLVWDGVLLVLLQSVAVVALEVTGALFSLPPGGPEERRGGGPLPAGIFAAVGFFLLGLGAGASMIPLLQIAMAEVPKEDAGLASGIVNVSMQMSAAVGLAALSTIATNYTKSLVAQGYEVISALADGYRLALLIAAASVLVGLALAPFLLRTNESAEEESARMAENMENPETYEHLVL